MTVLGLLCFQRVYSSRYTVRPQLPGQPICAAPAKVYGCILRSQEHHQTVALLPRTEGNQTLERLHRLIGWWQSLYRTGQGRMWHDLSCCSHQKPQLWETGGANLSEVSRKVSVWMGRTDGRTKPHDCRLRRTEVHHFAEHA